jgi:hypothetical protein
MVRLIWRIDVGVETRVIEEMGVFLIILPEELSWSNIFSKVKNWTELAVIPVRDDRVDMKFLFEIEGTTFQLGLIGNSPSDSSELQNLQLVGELLDNKLTFVYYLGSQHFPEGNCQEVLFLTGKRYSEGSTQVGTLNLSECWHG